MTPTPIPCGRCGRGVEEDSFTLTIDRGPLASSEPPMRLCPHCSKSIDRWYAKGARSREKKERESIQVPRTSQRNRPKHRSEWKRSAKRAAFYVVFTLLTFTFAWFIIKNATRPPIEP